MLIAITFLRNKYRLLFWHQLYCSTLLWMSIRIS